MLSQLVPLSVHLSQTFWEVSGAHISGSMYLLKASSSSWSCCDTTDEPLVLIPSTCITSPCAVVPICGKYHPTILSRCSAYFSESSYTEFLRSWRNTSLNLALSRPFGNTFVQLQLISLPVSKKGVDEQTASLIKRSLKPTRHPGQHSSPDFYSDGLRRSLYLAFLGHLETL